MLQSSVKMTAVYCAGCAECIQARVSLLRNVLTGSAVWSKYQLI